MQPPRPESAYSTRPGLGRDDRRPPGVLHVDAGMAAVRRAGRRSCPRGSVFATSGKTMRGTACSSLALAGWVARDAAVRPARAGEEEGGEESLGLSSGGVSCEGALRFALEAPDASRRS